MFTRRTFLQISLAGVAATAVPSALADSTKKLSKPAAKTTGTAVKHRPVGVQLYTFRDTIEKDLAGVLKELQTIGYKEVELFPPLYKLPAKKLLSMLADHGLTAPSGHFEYSDMDSQLDYAEELGLKYVICPMLPRDWNWKDADVFKKASAEFNVWGADLRQRKIRFGFHNHNYEFKTFDGRTGFDIIVESTDPKLVCFELDCYWLTQSGNDPVAVIRKLGDRVRLLHLKDRKPGFPATQVLDDDAMHFTEVGSGTIDWKAVIEVAKEVGVEHLVVERDNGDLPPLKSASISFRNLQKLL